jgi:Orsellinic acid/F9775 biosynthesis cluster protein D
LCTFSNSSLDRVQEHIQKIHNNNNKVNNQVTFFPSLVNTSSSIIMDNDSVSLASGEESTSDVAGPSTGPIRGRQLHFQVKPSPYERTREQSTSPSSVLSRRVSHGSLSPLLIPLPLAHLATPPTAPSPLNQLAYSRPSSPTPPPSDHEMNVDEAEPSVQDDDELRVHEIDLCLNEEEVLAKASIAIIPLPYLQTNPTTRLLTCTKCFHGILASSLISHANSHNIKLLPEEKRNLQKIMASSSFLQDSNSIPTPTPPCPPIEGIQVQDGFSCNICDYCCVTFRSMPSHFSNKHKDVVGFAKANSKPVQVQALFARRPKYFAVTPSLRGHNEDDLFTAYLQQCAPEIEALKILNPPLNPNEVPPLLKVTQWHEHLKDYTSNRNSVQKLLELITLPTSRQGNAWMGSSLRATVEGYMKDVGVKANTASLGIRCLLKECPRFVSYSLFIC